MWTDEKQQRLEALAARKLSAREIGALLGFSRNAVIGRARRTGVPLCTAKRRPVDLVKTARALYLAGKTYAEISKITGFGEVSIGNITEGLPRRRPRAGSKVYARTLLKLRVLAAIEAGQKVVAVARRFNLPTWVIKVWRSDAELHAVAKRLGERNKRREALRLKREFDEARRRHEEHLSELARINAALTMSAREREILWRRLAKQPFSEVGAAMGLTGERVRQIQREMMARGARFS